MNKIRQPRIVEGRANEGQIRTDIPPSELFAAVLDEGVVLLKNVFDASSLLDIRDAVHEWGKTEPPAVEGKERSWHRIDNNPSKSETPHCTHFYNFVLEGSPSRNIGEIDRKVLPLFQTLKNFQNSVADTSGDFGIPDRETPVLHPQIIQYPLGGGRFDSHTHPFLPQKIGVIVLISQKGTDFQKGGTVFETKYGVMSSEDIQEIGDVLVFKYDIPHWVVSTEGSESIEEIDFDSPKGRWTAILLYY